MCIVLSDSDPVKVQSFDPASVFRPTTTQSPVCSSQ